MSDRIKPSWRVIDSIENDSADFCVDIFIREDATYGFEEFRRDPEDMGKWTGLSYYSALVFTSEREAREEAIRRIVWLE